MAAAQIALNRVPSEPPIVLVNDVPNPPVMDAEDLLAEARKLMRDIPEPTCDYTRSPINEYERKLWKERNNRRRYVKSRHRS